MTDSTPNDSVPIDETAPILDPFGPDPRAPLPAAAPVDLVFDGGHANTWVFGEIDAANSALVLGIAALALSDPRVEALVVDLSRVDFMDSSGVGALVQLRNHASATDKQLTLRGISPAVGKVLALTGLDEVFGTRAKDPGRC